MQGVMMLGQGRNLSAGKWRGLVKKLATTTTTATATVLFLFIISAAFFAGIFLTARWTDSAVTRVTRDRVIAAAIKPSRPMIPSHTHKPIRQAQEPTRRTEIPFTCPLSRNQTRVCPAHLLSKPPETMAGPTPPACPDYFRWIHEDLRPWKDIGISLDMVERARRTANFRLVIVNGKPYIERYKKSFQTRDVFTVWGILQLLRRYPGRLPDLDLMFDCVDWPVIRARDYRRRKNMNETMAPPPLFRYCGDDETLDIVFPDWSFWGW